MATVERFQELRIWQEGIEIFKCVYELTRANGFSLDLRLRDQIRASAGSIPDNIAEGFERSGRAEFIQSLFIAKGETGELRSQLVRCREVGLIPLSEANQLILQVEKLAKSIHTFGNYLKKSEIKGLKFKDRLP